MAVTISIQNVGPLVDTGNVDLSRFNIIIGKQSTGKSTFMKILCFCQWLEKQIMSANDKEVLYNYTHYYRFLKELKQFHRLNDSFFTDSSYIHYDGEGITIDFLGDHSNAQIVRKPNFEQVRHNTKLSFIPSERNLVSALKNVDRTYRTNENDLIFNHIFEWSTAKENTSENSPADLSIVGDMEYYYDSVKDSDFIVLKKQHRKIAPIYASSGVQSVLPIIVMINYFTSKKMFDSLDLSKYDVTALLKRLTESKTDEKPIEKLVDQFSMMHRYKNTKLFIEEPEQNLFPESQQELVNFMVRRVNEALAYTDVESTLTLTTHSPYIITAFNVLIRAAEAMLVDMERTKEVVSPYVAIPLDQIRAYYINESGSMISILDEEIGMISGVELDNASSIVEDKLSQLNDVIYG